MTLEELLNKLIEKGWKPFGDENVKDIKIYSDMDIECIYWKRKSDFYYTSYRKLTSKESWLWQFCCSKGLVDMYEWFYWQNIFPLDSQEYDYTDYQYWILESSLKDEEDLEKFLLENIKVS